MIPGIIGLVSVMLVTIGKARIFGYSWECGKGISNLQGRAGLKSPGLGSAL